MNDIHALYALWKKKAVADPDLQAELLSVEGNEEEILDRFYKNLEFGTAGLRGVIGAGKVFDRWMKDLLRVPAACGISVLGLYDGAPELARAKAETYGIPKCFSSYQELLADPEIDAVYVATPNHLHAPTPSRPSRRGSTSSATTALRSTARADGARLSSGTA